MKQTLRIMCALACAFGSFAQTKVDLRTQGRNVDFSGAAVTKPMQIGSSLPASCTVGQMFFLTSAQSGANVYGCSSGGSWNAIIGAGGGAVFSVAGKTGNVVLQTTDLSDCRLSLVSPTVISFNGCAFSFPNVQLATLPAGTITLLGGSGDAFIYATPGGAINVMESGSLSIACTGCTNAGPGTGFPADVAPLGAWASTITPGNWDPTMISDNRTLVNGPIQILPDTGVAITLNNLGQKLIGMDPAVVETRAAEQAGQEVLCTASGNSSAQTCSLLPTLTAYTSGMRIRLLSAATNSGAATLNIDGLGAKSILRPDGQSALGAGDLTAGNYYDLTYDGTVFRLQSAGGGGGSGSVGATGATGPAGPTGATGPAGPICGTTGQLIYNSSAACAGLMTGAANQVLSSGGGATAPSWADSRDVKVVPFAAAAEGVAGAAVSFAAGQWTPAARAGSYNLGAALQAVPATGAALQFLIELPADWDTSIQPYINVFYGSGVNSAGTVIWKVSSACSKQDGSVSDDPVSNVETAFGAQTMAAANRMWARGGQFTAMTAANGCVAGSSAIITVAVSGTASAPINAYQAVLTIPTRPVAAEVN